MKWKASSTRQMRSRASNSTRLSTIAAPRPAASNAYMGEGRRCLQIRPGGDADELRLHVARPLQGRERSAATRSVSSPILLDKEQFAQLGGQGISVVSYSDKKDAALQYIKWFAQPEVQARSGGDWVAIPA